MYAVDDNRSDSVCVLVESGTLGASLEILVDVADSCVIRAVLVQVMVALRSGEQFLLRPVAKIGFNASEHGCIFADSVVSVSNGFVELGYSVRRNIFPDVQKFIPADAIRDCVGGVLEFNGNSGIII